MWLIQTHDPMIPRETRAKAENTHSAYERRDVRHVRVAVGVLVIGSLQRLMQSERQYKLIYGVGQRVNRF